MMGKRVPSMGTTTSALSFLCGLFSHFPVRKKKFFRFKYGKIFKTQIQNNTFRYSKIHLTEEYAARDRDLQYLKRLPDSHYKIYFDWSIPGEISKWEDLLFFEDLDMTVFKN